MFRRKEENAADAAANPSEHAASGAPQHSLEGITTASAQAPAQSAAAAVTTNYAPSSAPRSVSDSARPANAGASAPAGNNYRASPLADFSRGVTRTEAPRAASSAPATSSFTGSSERSSTGTQSGKSNRRVLTVGNDILLKGEIATCDRLVIEGRVEAKLSEVHTVEIAECGSFKGTAEVEDAEVSGVFEGDLIVRNRLVIYASGEVRGNISYGEIEIERGGRMTGQIKTGATQGGKADSKARKETVAA